MSIFESVSQADFLQHYWQTQSLVFPRSFPELRHIVDGNELAGLASESGVEARIIKGHGIDGDWDCLEGPFTQQSYSPLGTQNWTLLVQGVDQWDDDIKAILNRFDFIPKWRLEDIMASYAPIGGSVGPHFDYYDVFLIQISGRREWQIGQRCDDTTPLQNNQGVKLLTEFNVSDTHTLEAGDMIYVPAGLAHWGTSLSDDCITFSIGFRAPSDNDIIIEALEGLIQHFSKPENKRDHKRYRDTLASIDPHPNKINLPAQKHLEPIAHALSPELINSAINQALGQLVTDPRYDPFDDEHQNQWTTTQLLSLFNNDNSIINLKHSANSRFAFSELQLFVNGEAYNVDEAFAKSICEKALPKPASQNQIDILLNLLNQGFITPVKQL